MSKSSGLLCLDLLKMMYRDFRFALFFMEVYVDYFNICLKLNTLPDHTLVMINISKLIIFFSKNRY
jgi:hypothetical protein